MAADIIAERHGWEKAEERENRRMERIHDVAMKVLKGMDAWDIETYFAQMRRSGFEVDPVYDRQGICRGYSIGEKLYDLDGNYSSTVMYKASSRGFGHGRDLTVSKLFGTWQKLHPEQEETRTESYHWQQNRQEEVIPQKPSLGWGVPSTKLSQWPCRLRYSSVSYTHLKSAEKVVVASASS